MRGVSVPQRARGRVRPRQGGLRDSRGVEARPLRVPEGRKARRPDRTGGLGAVRRGRIREAQGKTRPSRNQPRASARGLRVSERRVPNAMGKPGLRAEGATGGRRGAKAVERGDPRANLTNRAFDVGSRNRPWVGDVACVPTDGGRPCLAAAMDARHRKAIGRSTSGRIAGKPAADALDWTRPSGGGTRQTTAPSRSTTARDPGARQGPSSDAWNRTASHNPCPGPAIRGTTPSRSRSSKPRSGS